MKQTQLSYPVTKSSSNHPPPITFNTSNEPTPSKKSDISLQKGASVLLTKQRVGAAAPKVQKSGRKEPSAKEIAATMMLSEMNTAACTQPQPSKSRDVSTSKRTRGRAPKVTKKRKIEEISNEEQPTEQIQQNASKRLNQEVLKQNDKEEIVIRGVEEEGTKTESINEVKVSGQLINKSLNPASIIAGLSKSTLKNIKKAVLPKATKESQMKEEYKVEPKQKSSKKPLLAKEFSFSELEQNDHAVQCHLPDLNAPIKYSTETLKVIDDIMNDPYFEKQTQHRVGYDEIMKEEHSMRFKHEQLLKVKKELVIPAQYKKLLLLSTLLDNSLNFLKQLRKSGGNFEELKSSIEKTHGRRFELSDFKRILTVVPEFYSHRWEQGRNQREPNLFIDFGEGQDVTMGQSMLEERQNIFKQRLLDLTKQHHDTFIQNLRYQKLLNPSSIFEIDINLDTFDPIQAQMWHYKFDPHSVEDIAQTELQAQPKQVRSESVKEFLDRSNVRQSLVQQALSKTAAQGKQRNSKSKQSPGKELKKFQEWSARTGLSIETLRQIEAKSSAIKQSQDIMNRTMHQEDQQKKVQQLEKTCAMIYSAFIFKGKTAMSMNELVENLNDSMRGQFQSNSNQIGCLPDVDQIQDMIVDIANLIPEWISVKGLSCGKFVYYVPGISQHKVQEWLRGRIQEKAIDSQN